MTKIEEIIKDYKDFLDNPYADGYTVKSLESKYGMSIEKIRDIYKTKRDKSIMDDKTLLSNLGKIVGKGNSYLDNDSVIRQIRELLQDNGWIK